MIMEIKDLIQQHTANIFTVKVQLKITVNCTSTELEQQSVNTKQSVRGYRQALKSDSLPFIHAKIKRKYIRSYCMYK